MCVCVTCACGDRKPECWDRNCRCTASLSGSKAGLPGSKVGAVVLGGGISSLCWDRPWDRIVASWDQKWDCWDRNPVSLGLRLCVGTLSAWIVVVSLLGSNVARTTGIVTMGIPVCGIEQGVGGIVTMGAGIVTVRIVIVSAGIVLAILIGSNLGAPPGS